ncbi:MAG TPA: GDYXXLXY domain-containing protein [Rhizobiales bacterium]|nr:GDYXXLXY domain-containing protein [Hyphomicrobiales bacterium]
MIRANRLVIAAIALSLVQIAFLSWMIAGRAAILRNGAEVLLRIQPIDPRDLLRGDYVVLAYDISQIPAAIIANVPEGMTVTEEGPIYVRLAKGVDKHWNAVSANLGKPSATPPAPGEVDIRGWMPGGWSFSRDITVRIEYGIERFYLPEGEGLPIQNDIRERPFSMLVAVARDGSPQIKALLDGETVLYEEPPY